MSTPSSPLNSRIVSRSPVYYGWIILIVGTLGVIMSSPGQTYSFSIFIEEFIRDLGLSRTTVSSLYTVGTIVGSLALTFIGRNIDKRGNRRMVVLIALAFGVAIVYMSTVRSAAMLLVGIIFMRMLGQSSMTIVSYNVMNQWWVQRRGLVLGISTLLSATLGPGLFPNLINWLIPQIGWRSAYLVLATIVVGTMVPLGWLFYRERPERYGLLPDGTASRLAAAKARLSETTPRFVEHNWTAREAMGTYAFWIIVLSISAFAMLATGLTFHIVSIFADNGLSADLAAAIFLPMSLTTSLFAIPGGWLIDRIDAKYMLAFGLILQATTILVSTSIATPLLAVAYGVIFGLTSGVARVIANVIWANYFGRKYLGTISGVTSTITAGASGVGPLIYGLGRDLAGSYWPSLWISSLFPLTLAVFVLFMRRPVKATDAS